MNTQITPISVENAVETVKNLAVIAKFQATFGIYLWKT